MNCSAEGLFDFLAQPENVIRVSSPDLGITFSSAPIVIEQGSQLDFQIITFGQLVKSSHHIVEFSRPELVIEQQLVGPMKTWIHRHEYEATPDGVVMRDIVEFEKPGGIVGLLLTESKISDHLEDGFFYREQRLKELVSNGEIA
ncbi:SRPBCC family protein [Planctomicrobium sp. SH527]|uniref:SRPBCC family protein n=1 Tax=Planctomicrobium sp. SH527 TaxID=3448123 RepID=UPI003F5C05C7